jgi:hypothetical protein
VTQAIHVTAGNHRGPASERGLEQFGTPPCATEALLDSLVLPRILWDPCAGEGYIAQVLSQRGHHVYANDLATDGVDFLQRVQAPHGVGAIVTNPPFSLAADFVRQGLTLVQLVIILERIQFLESDERTDILEGGKLARVLVFSNRVPRMHRADWTGKRASPAMCLAWFVFDRGHRGPTTIERVRCNRTSSRPR